VQAVLFGLSASAGQSADAPVQASAASQSPTAARQVVAGPARASVGQVTDVPVQVSATSQTPADPRQVIVPPSGLQVPTNPGRLQAPQPPLQALSQQTPPTQKPLAHWLLLLQPRPNEPS
jgi:hypothetical protein